MIIIISYILLPCPKGMSCMVGHVLNSKTTLQCISVQRNCVGAFWTVRVIIFVSESPKSSRSSSTQPERSNSSLLLSTDDYHPHIRPRASTSPLPHRHSQVHHHPGPRYTKEGRPTPPPLSFSPQQEMGTSGSQCITLPGELRGFPSSASCCSSPSHHMHGTMSTLYTRPVQERLCSTATSSPVQKRPNRSFSISCDNCHAHQLKVSALAIDALCQIAKQSTSCVSVHSDKACDYCSSDNGYGQSSTQRHSATFTMSGDDPDEKDTPVLTHQDSYVASDEEAVPSSSDTIPSEHDGNIIIMLCRLIFMHTFNSPFNLCICLCIHCFFFSFSCPFLL